MLPDPGFWRGKRVLLTGHSGFKGAWLALWLQRLGAHVTGVALPPATQPNLFDAAQIGARVDSRWCDINDAAALRTVVAGLRPEIVLHLAAQSLVRASYAQPLETFAVNVMGTAHLLEAVRHCGGVRVVVAVTTDKVYQNHESQHAYAEGDALGGHDPYSASKAAAELVVASYRAAFLAQHGTAVASARAGNVRGGGDWAADRLLPDAFRAWSSDVVLEVRRPLAVRPWQHVLDPLAGYLRLTEILWDRPDRAGAFNFGPDRAQCATVGELVQMAQRAFGCGQVRLCTQASGPHEAQTLLLDNARARAVLGVAPCWPLERAVTQTMAWYRRFAQGTPASDLCLADLADFEASHHAPAATA